MSSPIIGNVFIRSGLSSLYRGSIYDDTTSLRVFLPIAGSTLVNLQTLERTYQSDNPYLINGTFNYQYIPDMWFDGTYFWQLRINVNSSEIIYIPSTNGSTYAYNNLPLYIKDAGGSAFNRVGTRLPSYKLGNTIYICGVYTSQNYYNQYLLLLHVYSLTDRNAIQNILIDNNTAYSSYQPYDITYSDGFLYIGTYSGRVLKVNTTTYAVSTLTAPTTSRNVEIYGLTIYGNKLYTSEVAYSGDSQNRIRKYNLTNNTVSSFYDNVMYPTSVQLYNNSAIYAKNGNLYCVNTRTNNTEVELLILSLPTPPLNITSIDSGNTITVGSGNLKVSLVDNANKASNNVYYYYSLNNTTFINSNVKSNGPSLPNYFYVNVPTITSTIYVYAYNDEGISTTISQSVTVYQTPRQPSSYTVSFSSSGNINVSVTETSPPANYNLNGVSYWYYLYTTGTNQFANVAAYSQGSVMDSSYTTNFVIQNLQPNNYRVYVLAKNTVGNSAPFLSTNANVAVFSTPFSPNSYSLSFDELNGITVSITDTSNVAINQVYYHYYYYRIGDTAPNQSTDISVYANTYVPVVSGQTSYSFTIKGLQTSYYNVYIAAKNTVGATIYSPVIAPVDVICFKEDSRILTNRGYRKIQYLKRGDLVKTFKDGFKPIYKIGKKEIVHVPSGNRAKERLYKCSPDKYPEVFEDLVLTGCHSILVDEFVDDEQRRRTQQINGGIYVTDKKYRLPVCADERATVYEHAGKYAVYHIALENDDYYMNYGIYANGLLVESTSKRFLDEYKVMETTDK